MRAKVVLSVFWCLATLALAPYVLSQASTSLSGHVTDANGATLPGASVKLSSPSTGSSRSAITNASGDYTFSQLTPGHYELSVSFAGFSTTRVKDIEVLVSQPATMNVVLQVASQTSDVTVTSEVQPMLNTTDATLGNAFSGEQVKDLPIEGRNVPDLLSLQPGVTFLGRTDSNTGSTSVGNTSGDSRSGATNGGRSDQSNITLDGIDVNDVNNGYAFTSILRITQDATAEFRVTTSNPNAEEGRSSGAQVALVTRSGTNNIHGAVYAYNRNSLFHANDFFNKQTQLGQGLPNKPLKLIRNVFGAAIGGPAVKDRFFYFFNYEGRRDDQGFVSNGDTVPTAAYKAGYISYHCVATSSGCPQSGVFQLTPANLAQMDPQGIGPNAAVQKLFNQYPTMTDPHLSGDGVNTGGFSFSYVAKRRYDTYISRLDWKVTSNGKHTLFWRGNIQDDYEPNGPQFPGQPASTTLYTGNKGFAVGYTYLVSSDLVNNLAFGLTRQAYSTSGLLTGPYVTLQGVSSLTATTSSTTRVVPVYNLTDNLSWTKHGHNLAFGINFRFITNGSSSNALSYPNASGTYQYLNPGTIAGSKGAFDPTVSGFPEVLGSWKSNYNKAIMGLVGIVNVGNITYNNTKDGTSLPQGTPVKRNYRWNEYEGYVQDSWNAAKGLTLTYGVRYSYLQVPAETSGNQVGVCKLSGNGCASGNFSLTDYVNDSARLAAAGQSVSGAGELAFPLAGRYNHKPDLWTPDKFNFAPRIAFAYSPSGTSGFLGTLFGNSQTSIRGGYSLVYDHFGAGITNSFDTDGSYGLSTSLQTSAGSLTIANAPRFTSVNSVPSSLLAPPPAVGFPGIPVRSGPNSGAIYWSQDSAVKTPYAHLIDLSIARSFRSGGSLEISYVGHLAHRLLEQEDVAMPTNLAAAGTTYFAAARNLSKMARNNVDVSTVAPIAYWQQLFGALDGQDIGFGPGYTATQNIYMLYQENLYNEANALYALDMADTTTGDGINPNNAYPSNRFYHDQFSALYAWRTIGSSNYNALQAVYRQRFGLGLQADFNYTLSKSLDTTSQAERLSSSGSINNAQIFNTWDPNQLYGVSDFDVRHQLNANYVWNLPFGRGNRYAASISRLADKFIGGWQTTGIVRWTSGLPFAVQNGANFPTNYDIQGFATQIAKIPSGHGKFQQRFANPDAVLAAFDFTLPGDSGTRNPLRGDGYFEVDAGLGKSVYLTERVKVKAGIEVFNVSNSVRFDPHTISAAVDNPSNFGNANSTLTNPRLAQFYGRIEF